MGLENLRSVFQEQLDNSIEDFSSNVITNVNDTKLTQFTTPALNELIGESPIQGMSWESLYDSNHSPKDNPSHKGLIPINYPNASRDNLNIRNPEDGRFGFAGSSRTSVISAVGKLIGQVPFLDGDITEFLRNTGKEPYIVSSIGKGGRRINSNFGGRGLPIERMLTDTVRVAKYLTSPDGLLFIAKQNALSLQQVPITQDFNRTQLDGAGYRDFGAKHNLVYKSFYNPLSSLIATFGRAGGGPAGKIGRTEPGLAGLISSIPGLEAFGDVFDAPYPKYQTEMYDEGSQLVHILNFGRSIDGQFSPKGLFESDLPTTDRNPSSANKYADGAKDESGFPTSLSYPTDLGLKELNRTFTDGDSETGVVGDKQTILGFGVENDDLSDRLARPQYEDTLEKAYSDKENTVIEGTENGMPFYFKDMRDGAYVHFRAYLEGISENVSPNYNPTSYIGRSEPVYTYNQTERDLNFTLKLFAQTKDELKMIYKKMNRLTSMCYPEYFEDKFEAPATPPLAAEAKQVNFGNRMKPPLTKLRIGELYGNSKSELLGYIKTLSYSVDQTSPFETESEKRVPKFIIATISYQVIHSEVPNLKTKFYGYVGD
jgi:hypothetical protein